MNARLSISNIYAKGLFQLTNRKKRSNNTANDHNSEAYIDLIANLIRKSNLISSVQMGLLSSTRALANIENET